MARIQAVAATKPEVAKSAMLEWDWRVPEWAQEGAYVDDEYPEPADDERLFYTMAIKVGRKRNLTACVDVLAVTSDLEYAIERRYPATLDDNKVQLRDHDRVPAGFCAEVPDDSKVPKCRYEMYTILLERAHGIEADLGGGSE